MDKETINKSILKTKRLVVADPGWQSFGAASEIITLVMEKNMHTIRTREIKKVINPYKKMIPERIKQKYGHITF